MANRDTGILLLMPHHRYIYSRYSCDPRSGVGVLGLSLKGNLDSSRDCARSCLPFSSKYMHQRYAGEVTNGLLAQSCKYESEVWLLHRSSGSALTD